MSKEKVLSVLVAGGLIVIFMVSPMEVNEEKYKWTE